LLEGIASDPGQCLGALPLLTPVEREQLVVDWNATATDYPRDRCLPQLFEEQVARTPDAVAAVFEEEEWTYRELNRRANRAARTLVEQGVGPDVVVALLAERSVDLLSAILAVFKAGGAYLPLDPRQPASRLVQVLEQSGSPVVLATCALQSALAAA